jgi:alginate O-acetyltransferase complex protein AlgJ
MMRLTHLPGDAHVTVRIVAFMAALWLPLAATFWANHSGIMDATEKRKLADLPTLKLTSQGLNAFAADFNRYFDDNFGMRQKLVVLHSYLKGVGLKVSPIRDAIIGKNGWLYLGDENIVADYRNAHPLTDPELRLWRDVLVKKRDWLAQRGIKYLFVVAPDKHSIYPEYMPNRYNKVSARSCLDQLIAYMNANSDFEIVDLRPSLIAQKATVRVFHKTDTHWNDPGAFVAYREIMRAASAQLPQLKPKDEADYRPVEYVSAGRDLANMMGLRAVIHERILKLVPLFQACAQQAAISLPPDFQGPNQEPGHEPFAMECSTAVLKAVVFRDSFGTALVPYLSENFRRTAYIWDYPNRIVLNTAIESEHPDIVIEERVERHLKPFLPEFKE